MKSGRNTQETEKSVDINEKTLEELLLLERSPDCGGQDCARATKCPSGADVVAEDAEDEIAVGEMELRSA